MVCVFFFSSRRRHTRCSRDWSSDVCSSDLDLNLSSKQRLQFRRTYFTFWEYQPLDGNTNETPKYFNRPNQTNSIDHVWTLSPNKVNEVLFTFSLDQVYIPKIGRASCRERV